MPRSGAAAWFAGALVALALAGCLGSSPGPGPPAAPLPVAPAATSPAHSPPARAARGHAVLAIIDTGIDPYQEAFRAPDLPEPRAMLAGYPADARPVRLHLAAGPGAGLDQDRAELLAVRPGELVWFPGTRIVGAIRFGTDPAESVPLYDTRDHGGAVAQVAARAGGGDVLLVAVQVGFGGAATPYTLAAAAQALRWVASQAWIDAVSLSLGDPAQVPLDSGEGLEFSQASRAAAEAGKLVVFAAGNEVVPAAVDRASGPPWVVAVGGADAERGGVVAESAWLPDVVSDWGARVPRPGGTTPAYYGGTSFAAPVVAGLAAGAIAALRPGTGLSGTTPLGARVAAVPGAAADGWLSPAELREALNATAAPLAATAYAPAAYLPSATEEPPPLPALPPGAAQAGWGYLGPGALPGLVQHLQGEPGPDNPNAAAMRAAWAVRAALWR